MATITSAASGPWSAGSTWAGGAVPADNDTVVIAAGHSVEFDVDMSAWVNGVAGLTIEGHATTPAMLYAKHSVAGTYHLKLKTGTLIQGTNAAVFGRLLANADGVWGNTGALPFDRKFIIDLGATGSVSATYLDIDFRCTEPEHKYVLVTGHTVGSPVITTTTDVTADPQWAPGARVVLADEGPADYDQQRTTLASVDSATQITLGANVDSAQYNGAAKVWLVSRNVEVRSSCTTNVNILNGGKNNHYGCAIISTAGTGTTVYGYGINSGSGHTVSGTITGCGNGIYSGSGHTVSGTITGCGSGINYGSGHTVSGTITGCSSGIYSGSGHTVSGTITGCGNGISYGSGHTVSGTITGCSSGIFYGSGHTVSGTITGCGNGINYGSIRLAGALLSGNLRDLYNCMTAGSATLGSTVQDGAYKYVTMPMSECRYTALVYPLGEVDGAIGCWTQGGYCKSAVHSEATHGVPPTIPTLVNEQMFEDSNRYCYVELPYTVPRGSTMTVRFCGRLTSTATITDLPRVEIVDVNKPWLDGDVLASSQIAANTDWQTHIVTWENTGADKEVMLRVRVKGGTLTGTGTDMLYWYAESVDIVSTELKAELIDAVAAIKAKTDNLPASPAAVGSAMTLTPAYDRAKDDVLTPLAAVDGKVDSILEDTSTSIPTSIAELPTDADVQTAARAALDDYSPATWRDIPTDDEIQAAAQAAIVIEGVSKFDAATDAVRVGNIDDIDAALSAAHGSGAWGETVEGDTLLTEATVVDGSALGRILDSSGNPVPGATLTLYAAADLTRSTPLRRTTAAADGTWTLPAPSGSLVLVVSKDGFYDAADGDATIEVAITVP